MYRILFLFILALCATTTHAQFTPDITADTNPWTHLSFKNNPDEFQFVIVTDHTGGHRPGVFKRAIRRINLLQPEFVMCVGDLIEGGTEDKVQLDKEWTEMEGFINTLEMPFFYVPGNHDISNSVMLEVWKKKFGRSYYHFIYKNVLFIQMDSEDPPATNISDEQIAYVQNVLEKHKDVRWTLVFLHKPMWVYESKKTLWDRVDTLLQGRPYTVFAGHHHTYQLHTRYDRQYFTLATTGGSSSLLGIAAGAFDHVTWVTMTQDGPRMANLMLDGILEPDVRTEYTKSLTDPLFQRQGIWTGPLFVKQPTFSGDQTTLTVRNTHADQPLKISASFEIHENFRPVPRTFDLIVPPGETRELPVAIGISHKTEHKNLTPLLLAWHAQYDLPNRDTPLIVEGKNRMVVEPLLRVPKNKRPIVVDGHLEDWKNLTIQVDKPAQVRQNATSWDGPKDCQFSFDITSDDQYFYVAVRTVDDRVVQGKDLLDRNKDGITIMLNAQADPNRSQNQGNASGNLILFLYPGESLVSDNLPKGLQTACVATPTGVVAEIAVPISYLDAQQNAPWHHVRLNISVYDYDEGRARGAQLFWRPDWTTGQSYAGSGTFVRQ